MGVLGSLLCGVGGNAKLHSADPEGASQVGIRALVPKPKVVSLRMVNEAAGPSACRITSLPDVVESRVSKLFY